VDSMVAAKRRRGWVESVEVQVIYGTHPPDSAYERRHSRVARSTAPSGIIPGGGRTQPTFSAFSLSTVAFGCANVAAAPVAMNGSAFCALTTRSPVTWGRLAVDEFAVLG